MSKNEVSHTPTWVSLTSTFIRYLPAGRYSLIDWLCRRPSPLFWARVVTDSGEFSFQCDLSDSMSRVVCFTGQYEPQETALVKLLLKPGWTFVDIGANWGYYTLLASPLIGPRGRVISFEPDPRIVPILIENIKHNGLTNVSVQQVAAAAEPGTLLLSGYDAHGDNHGLSRIIESENINEETFTVQARPIDAVLDEMGVDHVDLLKMDIEGAEDLALRGMTEGLSRHRFRRILLELHPEILAERGVALQSILDLMTKAGYSGWWIDFSPEAIRKASYARSVNPKDYLRPLDNTLDSWPHVLWIAPGLQPVK